MQNEFEKQVQQKMEELKLVPSDPVWEKVEMQIRKKKDRRRIIFWIPLFALIGASLWIGIDQYSNKVAYNKENNKAVKQSSIDKSETNKTINEKKHQSVTNNKESRNQISSEITKTKRSDLTSTPAQKSLFEKSKNTKQTFFAKTQKTQPGVKDNLIAKNETVGNNSRQGQEDVIVRDTSLKNVQNTDTATSTNPKTETKNPVEELTKQDSTSIQKPEVKKHASSKWKYNLVAVAATSGLGRINVYNGQKSYATYSSPPSGASNGGSSFSSYGPSEVEKGFAFAVGAVAKTQLGKRTFFSTGLQYNYYSNTIQVGTLVNQNLLLLSYPVSRFYSNQGTVSQPYKNQYHFLSVPADFDWQLLKKHPLNLSLGLSLQYLVQSNALRFDYGTQTYFHDMAAFNRAQLISGFGLTYSVFLKQKPLAFGPQFQYGLTQLENGNSDHHIFSYGLKAQWQFKK